MLPSEPTVSPSTLPVAAGSTASTSTSPRFHAPAGAAARTPIVSPSAAANLNRVMNRLPVDLNPRRPLGAAAKYHRGGRRGRRGDALSLPPKGGLWPPSY